MTLMTLLGCSSGWHRVCICDMGHGCSLFSSWNITISPLQFTKTLRKKPSGVFTYCTEWMDVVAENYPQIAEHWYELEFLTLLWLLLPLTDGSTLLFRTVTEPLFEPLAVTLKQKAESSLSIFALIVNSSYLWIVWFAFLKLEEEAKRFIVIAVGTIYPIVASTVACSCAAQSGKKDGTFWLTYWSCFSILFIMMDYLENFVGEIQGFYSICLCCTIYLFLPMVSAFGCFVASCDHNLVIHSLILRLFPFWFEI